ncbi:IS66-like element accessory protein TnpA [Aquabacterium sp. OR-4]|uniref:IS66-like element accessory protein TnpA n=1 Tax=Aquabacterium sp. OR-4 TaxID=2978127 RepID=UPI0028CA5625|nr:transposase [Aquabacterium sp. OR-4]MDT7836261.1 transposase [Aquabacterium sp. OR-4]
MHPNSQSRRRHDADLKSKVIAACKEPGASVAAVALAHGLNANLVRKWLHGRGLKRAGLSPSVEPSMSPVVGPMPAADARFIPVVMAGTELAKPGAPVDVAPAGAAAGLCIEVELRRGTSSLSVRWPASSGADCAAWLRELAAGWLK